MKVAHVRERFAPAGTHWRLAVAVDTSPGDSPTRWLDLEPARRRAVARPTRARARLRRPSAAADDARRPSWRAACASRRCATSSRASSHAATMTTRPSSTAADLDFGPPILRPPSLRDFYAFEGHVRTMWERRGGEVPETWYRLPIFYFSNVSEIRGPDEPVWCAGRVDGARLRARGRGAHRHPGDRPCRRTEPRRRSAATRSSTTGRRATSSARRRPSGSGRPRARTSRARSDRGW